MDKLLNKAQACEILTVSLATLDRIVADGDLPVLRIRGQIRIQDQELLRYLGRCTERREPRTDAKERTREKGRPGRPRGSKKKETYQGYYPGMKVV